VSWPVMAWPLTLLCGYPAVFERVDRRGVLCVEPPRPWRDTTWLRGPGCGPVWHGCRSSSPGGGGGQPIPVTMVWTSATGTGTVTVLVNAVNVPEVLSLPVQVAAQVVEAWTG
jgi:hypothetical protein